MKKFSVFLSLFLLLSCGKEDNSLDLHLCQLDEVHDTLAAEELFSTVRFIPLETTKESLIGKGAVFAFEDNDILIWSDNKILHFDKNGTFIKRIGRKGNGHGEHGDIISANYDKREKVVYVGSGGGVFNKYALKGDFLGKFTAPFEDCEYWTSIWNDATGSLFLEARQYSDEGLKVSLIELSSDGKKMNAYPLYSDNLQVNRSMTQTGALRQTEEVLLFMLPFDDIVYCIKGNEVSKLITLNRGRYKPDRELCENWDNRDKLYGTKISITNWLVTNKHYYMEGTFKNKAFDLIIDRKTNKIIHVRRNTWGLNEEHLKLEGMERPFFWPWKSFGKKVVDIVPPEKFTQKELLYISSHGDSPYPIGEDMNPIIVVAEEF